MKRYYWLKLKEDFFRDKRIKKLRGVAGGDTYIIIYLKMQLLSLNNSGVLVYDGLEKNFAKELALEIDEQEFDIDFTIHYLTQCGMLVESEMNEFTLTETIKTIGSESDAAERMRKLREKEQLKIDICHYENDELNELFKDFLNLRKKLKAVNSERAITTLKNKIAHLTDTQKIECINASIESSWKGLFPKESKQEMKVLDTSHL